MMVAITGTHPAADVWPMLSDAELDSLAEDIALNGLKLPIVVDPDGLILDGRNRYAAHQRWGIDVDLVVEVHDGDPDAFVISANAERRHMSAGAVAMGKAQNLVRAGKRVEGKWAYGTNAQDFARSRGEAEGLRRAGVVLDHAPDLAEAVTFGHLALDAAYREACDRRDAERDRLAEAERLAAEEADARAFIEETDPDLAARVDGEDLQTYVEAQDLWRRRNREEAERLRREKAAREKREQQERQGRSDLYSGIARSLEHLAVYGRYDDVRDVMKNYSPVELSPTTLATAYDPTSLTNARRLLDGLIEWSAS